MDIYNNPYRADGTDFPGLDDIPWPSTNGARPCDLLARCPKSGVTPLKQAPDLASRCHVGEVWIKDERTRMGLGSFKALGAAYVIACDAQSEPLAGVTYVTASAGNHGLSVAAGAKAFGARSVVYIADTVPEQFADRLREQGAEVRRQGGVYEDSMAAAAQAATQENLRLLSDSSWPGYTQRPHVLMEGYLALMAEVFDQLSQPPTHLFLQAGVGGLAGAAAAAARAQWGQKMRIVTVEPEVALALMGSLKAGEVRASPGPESIMGRLDCKLPSLIALRGLARDCDHFVALPEAQAQAGADLAAEADFASTPSGAAGLAALLASTPHRTALGLNQQSRVLTILSEAPAA
ncbi:MAG: pyridoxal-phosphate dependent enzyme [Sedimentitalea sp.]